MLNRFHELFTKNINKKTIFKLITTHSVDQMEIPNPVCVEMSEM